MFSGISFSLSFAAGRLPVFLTLILIVAAVWYYYRVTLPPVPSALRVLLACLRGGALLLLAAALFGGVLSLTREREVKAPVAVLVDTSSSMGIGGGSRADTAAIKAFFSGSEWQGFAAAHDVRFFAFSDTVQQTSPAALLFNGPVTDIEQALQTGSRAAGPNTAALLLVSDGTYTRGGDPAAAVSSSLPVYTVISGDSGAVADVMVTSVQLSATGLAGHRIPVRVSVRGPGYAGESVRLELRLEDVVQDERRIRIPAAGFEKTETLYFETDRPGFTAVSARAAVLPGEVSDRNNEQTGYINITPGSIRVLLLASAPHQDTAFLIRTLKNDPFVDLTSRVLRDAGDFYEGPFPGAADLAGIDCVVLADMPGRRMDPALWDRIGGWLVQAGVPLFIQVREAFDPVKARRLEMLLPADGLHADGDAGEYRISLTETGRTHPVTGLGEGETGSGSWEQAPPLALSLFAGEPKPAVMVLATAAPSYAAPGDSAQPVLLAGVCGGVKSVLLNGTGLFRWSMQPGREGLEPAAMLHSTVRWLTSPENRGYYRLSSPRRVYETGEAIPFRFTAFDAIYRPLSGGQAALTLWNRTDTLRAAMTESGNGEYRCSLAAPGTGRWRAAVRFSPFSRQQAAGGDSTELFIQPFRAELQRLEPNPEVLRQISRASGGVSVGFSDAAALVDTLRFPRVSDATAGSIALNENGGILVLVLLLLFTEWLVRKRKGMV
ncbi:hypothetical protein JXO52_03965 [bacterium]|nr:hypothetical protein [bacterium]